MGVLGGGWVARSSGGSWVWNLKSGGLADMSFAWGISHMTLPVTLLTTLRKYMGGMILAVEDP